MKKICIALCALLVFACSGCASGGTLTLDDFGVYEDGEVIVKSVDILNNTSTFGTVFFSQDFEDREPETARGIKIGSTAREVAEAYGDNPAWLSTVEGTVEIYADFLDRGGAKELESDGDITDTFDYLVLYRLYELDGELLTHEEYEEIAPDGDFDEFQAFWMENPDGKVYQLRYLIKDGEVVDIQIYAHTFYDLAAPFAD